MLSSALSDTGSNWPHPLIIAAHWVGHTHQAMFLWEIRIHHIINPLSLTLQKREENSELHQLCRDGWCPRGLALTRTVTSRCSSDLRTKPSSSRHSLEVLYPTVSHRKCKNTGQATPTRDKLMDMSDCWVWTCGIKWWLFLSIQTVGLDVSFKHTVHQRQRTLWTSCDQIRSDQIRSVPPSGALSVRLPSRATKQRQNLCEERDRLSHTPAGWDGEQAEVRTSLSTTLLCLSFFNSCFFPTEEKQEERLALKSPSCWTETRPCGPSAG